MSETTGQNQNFVLDEGVRVLILTRGAETGGRHDLVEATQSPGTMTPLHLHTRYDERLWVIEGELTVWAGRGKRVVGPGGFVVIPMNTAHMIQAGPGGARVLNITSPAGFAELVERTAAPAALSGAGARLDLDRFMEVTAELGDIVLGPPGTTPDQLEPRQLAGSVTLDALHERRPSM
jgi:mannose-6-phosphate isomerase-like protein (cupin superfamily)